MGSYLLYEPNLALHAFIATLELDFQNPDLLCELVMWHSPSQVADTQRKQRIRTLVESKVEERPRRTQGIHPRIQKDQCAKRRLLQRQDKNDYARHQ